MSIYNNIELYRGVSADCNTIDPCSTELKKERSEEDMLFERESCILISS